MVAELLIRPATELAGLVRAGEVTARELCAAALARIEALDPELNAVWFTQPERSLAAAEAIGPGDPRPFAGVPIAIKDLAALRGWPMTMGSDLFGDFAPRHDDFAIRRLLDAGFVVVGKTASPELGILPVTEPRRFGPTRSPWDPERTPGGSSGGSGAAVAAGMVPVAHGTDGGGSIRIPAACCGLVGLKPARGRISRGPVFGDSFLVTDGVLTRTVADSAALLDVLAGYEPGDATWAPPPPERFSQSARREPAAAREVLGWPDSGPFAAAVAAAPGDDGAGAGDTARPARGLHIALALDPAIEGSEVDPLCAQAARDAADLLASLGHEVEEARPPYPGRATFQTFSDVWATGIATGVAFGGRIAGHEARREDMEPLTWALYERGRGLDSAAYQLALAELQRVARGIVAWMAGFDAVLTPALAQRPVRHGEVDACGDDPWLEFAKSGAFTPYTAIWNVTGQAAISVPLFHGDDGLPLAVQLAGPPLGEGLLLALAAQLEAARPWAERIPALAA